MFVKPKYFNVNICILLQSLIFNLLKLLTFCQLIRSVDSWWKSGWWLVRLPIGQFLHIQPVGCSISLIYSGNGESCAFVVNTWNWGHNYLWASCIGSVSLQIFFPVALEPQTRWQLHLLHLTYIQLLNLQRDILIVREKEKIEKTTTTTPKGRAADREALQNDSI